MSRIVELTALTEDHLQKALEWRNDPKIYRWTRQNGPISVAIHKKYWDTEDPTRAMYGVRALTGPDATNVVGVAGLTSIRRDHGTAEFSLYIGPEHHRRGYGKKAMEALLYLGFGQLRLDLIYGETFEDNPALKMFLDIGMSQEAKLRNRYYKDGEKKDVYIVSMTRDEFFEKYSWMVES